MRDDSPERRHDRPMAGDLRLFLGRCLFGDGEGGRALALVGGGRRLGDPDRARWRRPRPCRRVSVPLAVADIRLASLAGRLRRGDGARSSSVRRLVASVAVRGGDADLRFHLGDVGVLDSRAVDLYRSVSL